MATRDPNFRIRATDDTRAAFASVSSGLGGLQGKAAAVGNAFGGLRTVVTGLVATLGAGAAFQGLRNITQGFDELSKSGQKIGYSTEQLSLLRYNAERAGVDFERLVTGLGKFNTTLVEAQDQTSEQGKLLKALGVDINHGPQKALRDLADAFADLEDGEVKTAAAAKIFGERVGRDMIPLLNQGAAGFDKMEEKARRFGQVLDEETGKAAEAFNDNLEDIGLLTTGIARNIVVGMVPALEDLTAAFADSAVETERWQQFGRDLGDLLRETAVLGTRVAGVFQVVGTSLGGLAAAAAAAVRGEFGQIPGIFQEIVAQRDRIVSDTEERVARLRGLVKAEDFGEDFAPTGRGGANRQAAILNALAGNAKKAKKETDDFKRALESLNAELNREQAEGSKVLEIIGQYELGTLKVTEAQKDQLVAVAAKIDLYKEDQRVQEEAAKAAEEFAKRTIAAAQERARAIEQLLGATKTGRIEENRRQFALVAAELERGGENASKAREAMRLLDEELASIAGKTDNVTQAWQELGPVFVSAFEDAIVEGEDFRDVLNALEKDLLRIGTRAFVTEPLGGISSEFFKGLQKNGPGGFLNLLGLGGGGAAAAGAASGALSAADLATAFVGFQHGGSFSVGGSGGADSQLVAFRATPGEKVTVNPPGGGGSGNTVNIVVNVPQNTSGASASQIATEVGRATTRALRRNG